MLPTQRLQKFQKNLRTSQTNAEHALWYHLRNRHFQGFKFRRQQIIQGYIVDFVCLKNKLIIELDGSQHMDHQSYDTMRTEKLQKDGYRILRFWNNEVLTNIEGVLGVILKEIHAGK